MTRIAIVTPTLPERRDWVNLQDLWYGDAEIERHYPLHGTAFEAVYSILEDIQTPYIVFAGDDDFHVPAQLRRMADFLDHHPQWSGVHGEGILCEVEGWTIGWTANYNKGMRIETAFTLMRAEVFKAGIEAACRVKGAARSRFVMDEQNINFRTECSRLASFTAMDGLQLIHCHHSGRGELETTEAVFRKAAERLGGGWLASWLPSRSCSVRNLRRRRSRFYREFQHFERTVETFKHSLHHPVFALARG